MAGTLESSDAQVTVEPGEGKIELTDREQRDPPVRQTDPESHTGDPGASRRGQCKGHDL